MAREVGVEGQLGGQAKVPGASGTWKGLTENVNQLAENLTTQVRAIAEVATAVTQGDLTRSITVQAKGEVAALKDTINEMIRNLRDTTQKNTEQDWLKTNLAKFSRMLQGQKDLQHRGPPHPLRAGAGGLGAARGVPRALRRRGVPAPHAARDLRLRGRDRARPAHRPGRGPGGPVRARAPQDPAHQPAAGLPAHLLRAWASAAPRNILVLPVVFESQVKGVLELASFEGFSDVHQAFLDQLTESIGIVINTIEANTRTEDLLTQSQTLAQELQSRQEELQTTNQELQEKARLLAHQNQEVERKNAEVEQARQALEEKARAARPHLEVQVRVPGQHVARAAHAAQLAADPLRPALGQRGGQPQRASRSSSRAPSTRRATTC